MNTYIKLKNEWRVTLGARIRKLKWYEWFDLRFIQLRDWFHLLGKEK